MTVLSLLALLLMAATGAMAQTTYTVTVKDGTEDAAKWTADPNPATAGQTVTVTYSGTKKVKSVKAVKKAGAITVTWDISNTSLPSGAYSYSKDDVTVNCEDVSDWQKQFMGPGTFTTTLGTFTKIEVNGSELSVEGSGWSGTWDSKMTWTGSASSVPFEGTMASVTSIVFTIE